MPERYRVDNHQPRNLYRGDEYIGVMFDPADTAMIAELLNGDPDKFLDRDGDLWVRQDDGMYSSEMLAGKFSLDYVKTRYGTWDEAAS